MTLSDLFFRVLHLFHIWIDWYHIIPRYTIGPLVDINVDPQLCPSLKFWPLMTLSLDTLDLKRHPWDGKRAITQPCRICSSGGGGGREVGVGEIGLTPDGRWTFRLRPPRRLAALDLSRYRLDRSNPT